MKNVHKYSLVATLAFGFAAFSGCAEEPRVGDELEFPEEDRPATTETEPIERPAGEAGMVVMTASFEPAEGAAAGPISGTVNVMEGTEPGGDYRLAVRLEGLGAGEHAWHIHSAPCGQEAPVIVPFTATQEDPGLAQPLAAGEDGVAEANVTVPHDRLSLDELKSGEYSLHVHQKGGVDHGPTVACANL